MKKFLAASIIMIAVPGKVQNAQESDTTEADSSNTACSQKTIA